MRTLEEIEALLEELRIEIGGICERYRGNANLSMVVFHVETCGDQIDSALTILRKANGHKSQV